MPAQRPQNTENFQYVDRISVDMIQQQGVEQFEKLVLLHVVIGGKPLVVDGFEDVLDPWTFTPEWLAANCGDKVENARNLTAKDNIPLTIAHYLKNMGLLTNQYFDKPDNYKDKNRQRIYLKDIDCPQVWHDKLREHIPSGLFYLNESTGEINGPGSVDEPTPNAPGGRKKGRGIARAGDLMSSLPPEMRAENLMCYIGHEGTYTPSHREMCASLGQNIMVNASGTVGEDGKPEKPGSSIWFMTETKDRHTVSEYWLSVLGHDIEVENHFAQVAAWKRAPFRTYVVEQRPGDFILIPPLAPHQVWNRGTRTMKVAWNRTTVETLEMAFKEALPNARMVCRDEQYKNKAIVYYTLLKYSNLLKQAKMQSEASAEQTALLRSSSKVRQVQKDFKRLFELYKHILLSEMFSPDLPQEHPEFMIFEGYVTCAYCRGNIFNRFLTCKACVHALGTEAEEPYDICLDCYAMGRSCACISGMHWVEQWRWKDLLYKYEEWRKQVIDIDNGRLHEKTPMPLSEERRSLQKKTLAQICQEQLKSRPFVDYKNPKAKEDEEKSDEEIIVNDDGTVRRTAKKRSKAWLANHATCHTCLHKHPKWKMGRCTTCDLWYCYGSLFRAHDIMPQTIMENPRWQCPHCRRVCNTGACRRDPRQRPYEPKGTLLGHDTKKVADARSVEALVDFSVSNLNWLRDEDVAPAESARLRRRREEADQAKQDHPRFDDEEDDDHHDQTQIEYSPVGEDESFLDPALRSNDAALPGPSAMLDGARPRNLDSPLDENGQGAAPYFDEIDGDDSSMYPELDGGESTVQIFRSSTKRGYADADDHIKLVSKRQKTDKPKSQAKSDATRQFLKKKEKAQLEQAKKDGRYIQVWGAMRNRSVIAKLQLPSEKLAEFRQKDLEKRRRAQLSLDPNARNSAMHNVAIIQSDVAGPKGQASTAANGAVKKSKKTRVALEDDDDFDIRKGESKRKGQHVKKRYEEIDVDSDEDAGLDSDEEYYAPRQRRRRENNDDLIQLPDDWKEGQANPRPNRQRQSIPARSNGAQIRPLGSRRPRASTGDIQVISDDQNSDTSEDEDQPQSQRPQPMAPMNREPTTNQADKQAKEQMERENAEAEARRALEEESNRLAKIQAARWAREDDDEDEENNVAEQLDGTSDATPPSSSPAKRVAIAPMQTNKNPVGTAPSAPPPTSRPSILSRFGPGRGGKKIKIVSAASKRQASASSSALPATSALAVNGTVSTTADPVTTTTATTTETSIVVTSGFTPVNKRKYNVGELRLSDTDDSDDGIIPAKVTQALSMRGGSMARGRGRGRGRPRGRGGKVY
ncbi:Transcription factor jumonji/aspartyl beta-hydroxylase [Lasiodiplodia theobromae]|uniref:Transcription factor jumonji/aspartyl beta-hydroxylase n=1 Tax=Lasiodiplodia theobromae TaxID=45133 RepID=UPI0015C33650|nr:Transcription factor jumonji/aspartyl beta-hydroxylase [Lasiodiplodia theobromae]KAF4538884.1 Transcription factor jumonji/aspartyl beta-hydroxylase [Lasiodiplodia theobromae]